MNPKVEIQDANILSLYYKDLHSCKPCSKEEEIDLFRKAKNGDLASKNKLIESNLRYVFLMAKRYANKKYPLLDLISEGNLGLLKAFEKFDETRNVKFYCYALWYVKLYMKNYIERINSLNTIEYDLDSLSVYVNPHSKNYESDYLNEYDEKDLNSTMDDGVELEEGIITDLLDKLTKREEKIIRWYYGIECKERTLEEIGEEFKMSPERVRQIKFKALRKLRKEFLLKQMLSSIYL